MRFFFILLLLASSCMAQNVRLEGVMPNISVTVPLFKKVDFNFTSFTVFNVHTEIVNGTEYAAQGRLMLVQPSLVYRLNSNISLAASYAYISPNPYTPKSSNILCPWQQIIYTHKLGGGRMYHRLRLEEMFTQKTKDINLWSPSSRVRYQIGLTMPLQGATLESNELYFNAHHESFFNTSGNYFVVWSENWNYAGVGYVVSEKIKTEIGLMNMSRIRNSNSDNLVFNSLQFSLFLSPFQKKQSVAKLVQPDQKPANIHFKSWPPN
jgi:Protein of unknown function (DUF2490)